VIGVEIFCIFAEKKSLFMDFIREITVADTNIFLFFNGLHNLFFDSLMWLISGRLTWVPLYAALLYIILKNWKLKGLWLVLALVLSIVIADQVASGIIKNAVERFRPSREWSLNGLVHTVNGSRGGRYGFVSSHAANTFALAVLTSLIFRNKIYSWTVIFWAAIVSYSRIYLGVHYPLDILGGIVVGIFTAFFLYFLLKKFLPDLFDNREKTKHLATFHIAFAATALIILMNGIIEFAI
jgi:undecaprenyl-diphosphatase